MNLFARIRSFFYRPPDFIIGGAENPYIRRWRVIPRNKYKYNIYLHNLLRDDDDRALHDHPWRWCSVILRGAYFEISRIDMADVPEHEVCYLHLSHLKTLTEGGEGYFYGEHYDEVYQRRRYKTGQVRFRDAEYAHRLEIDNTAGPCWTLFLTGRWVRQWGFWCRKGWVRWDLFVAPDDNGSIGAGCGEKS